MDTKKICAVVPAYKEEKRIGKVLKELKKSNVDEIIVVDDGSNDRTYEVAKKTGVRVIKNRKNSGKGYAMKKGVENTNANAILFCDADLKGFDYKIINDMINTFKKNNCEMLVAVRNSHPSKTCLMMWQGQRVVQRQLWDRIPDFYKKGFRVEMGMNLFCNKYITKSYEFGQCVKEKKHGILLGLYRRFFMILQMSSAILRYYLYDSIFFTQKNS